MPRRHGRHGPVPERPRLTHGQGADAPPGALRGPAKAVRHDDQRIALEAAQRSRVEVIRMRVRDEHEIERSEPGRVGGRPVPAQRPEPVAQERISQAAQAVSFDQDGRVPDVRQADAVIGLRHRPPTASRSGALTSREGPGSR